VTVDAAWDDAGTRAAFRRLRRVGRVWLGIATVCLIGFAVYATRLQDHADRLVAHGVKASGVVLADPPTALRCGQVAVPVAFEVSGLQEVHNFYVDGCGGAGLHKGRRVTVRYNRNDARDFIVNGTPSEEPLATSLAIVAFVASGFSGIGWMIRGRRLHLLRLTLTHNPWVETPGRSTRMTSPWTRGRYAVELYERASTEMLVTQPGLRRCLGRASGTTLVVAGIGNAAHALRDRDDDRLVLARPPRSRAATRRARGALAKLDISAPHQERQAP
jgi:hypothetical protein